MTIPGDESQIQETRCPAGSVLCKRLDDECPDKPPPAVAVEPALLTRAEAAKFLALLPRSFDELARRGELRPIRIPGLRRVAFSVEELRMLVAAWRAQSVPNLDGKAVLGDSSHP